ncbi:hypothetical protein GIS00_23570 [Nakamurella sp. YIM 132087]|uniref:Uncharacterized protein n=1 Tax=Nakamurella alba TaxID=2665158 RepID=A0A7K1FS00_9ACTN|nr:hypothetical protein [Nakamurella alba]MTD16918.1 hypothetical protein [Nakamurella alba]
MSRFVTVRPSQQYAEQYLRGRIEDALINLDQVIAVTTHPEFPASTSIVTLVDGKSFHSDLTVQGWKEPLGVAD